MKTKTERQPDDDKVNQFQFRGSFAREELWVLLENGVITSNDLVLLLLIDSLVKCKGMGCWASNRTLARITHKSVPRISGMIRKLKTLKLLVEIGWIQSGGMQYRILDTYFSKILRKGDRAEQETDIKAHADKILKRSTVVHLYPLQKLKEDRANLKQFGKSRLFENGRKKGDTPVNRLGGIIKSDNGGVLSKVIIPPIIKSDNELTQYPTGIELNKKGRVPDGVGSPVGHEVSLGENGSQVKPNGHVNGHSTGKINGFAGIKSIKELLKVKSKFKDPSMARYERWVVRLNKILRKTTNKGLAVKSCYVDTGAKSITKLVNSINATKEEAQAVVKGVIKRYEKHFYEVRFEVESVHDFCRSFNHIKRIVNKIADDGKSKNSGTPVIINMVQTVYEKGDDGLVRGKDRSWEETRRVMGLHSGWVGGKKVLLDDKERVVETSVRVPAGDDRGVCK